MPPKKKKLCFVLMPFKDDMKEVYWKAIKLAATEAGFECVRMDEVKGVYNINKKIIEHIFQSDVIVSDLTDRNPNVFYEMGVAHAIANKTLMIIRKGQDVPFDVHSYRCIPYDQTEAGLNELKQQIIEELSCIDEWCHGANNPVQEFKPYEALVPRSELTMLQKQLRQKEKLLSNSAPLTQMKELQQELQQTKKELEKRPQQTEVMNLKKEADLLRAGLREKEEVEKKLHSELHQIKVKLDETDKKKRDELNIIAPPDMVLIPGGSYTMGELKKPVALQPFYLAKFPVTNRFYRQFVRATKHREPKYWDDKKFNGDDQPVVGVSWHDAVAYCDWLTKTNKENRIFRLPSEAEWEWAAGRGELTYPWGNEKPDHNRANYAEKVGYPTPVGSYPAGETPDGLMDMAGNVWEWCADWYDEKIDRRVVRGGSWGNDGVDLSCSVRLWFNPGYRYNDVGFRVSCGA